MIRIHLDNSGFFDYWIGILEYGLLVFFFVVMAVWGMGLLFLSVWRNSGQPAYLGMVFFLLTLFLYKENLAGLSSYLAADHYFISLSLLAAFIVACLYCTVRAINVEAERRLERGDSPKRGPSDGEPLRAAPRRAKNPKSTR